MSNVNLLSVEQRSYLVGRINEIKREKIKAKAVELYGASGRPEQPTWGMVFEGIKNGDITLKEDKVDYTGPYLNPSDVVWPAMEAKAETLKAYKAMLEAESTKLIDGVYLDSATVEALEVFSNL
jgi:hypothetical protein